MILIDRTIICYFSEWTWEWWQWRGTPHSSKLQHYWNLTIRLFSVISRILVGGGSYPSAEKQFVYSTAPADWAIIRVSLKPYSMLFLNLLHWVVLIKGFMSFPRVLVMKVNILARLEFELTTMSQSNTLATML